MFELDPRLEADGPEINGLFDGFMVRIKQGVQYPWLVLIPKVADVSEIFDLNDEQRNQLMTVAARCGSALKQVCEADKINVECIGNICSQLHVHIIARKEDDDTWPATVWTKPFYPKEFTHLEAKLRAALV